MFGTFKLVGNSRRNQRGIAHLVFILIALVGIVAGVYLVQRWQSFFSSADLGNPEVFINIDASKTYQTMDGFGATHRSLVYEGIGDTLTPDLRAKAIEAIYKTVGISMGGIDDGVLLESPGGFNARGNDNDDPQVINWSGFQTDRADQMKTKVVEPAEKFGFEDYYLSRIINVKYVSQWLKDLPYEKFLDEAAEQVVASQVYWKENLGKNPRLISPFNEPTSGNDEVSSRDTQIIVDLVKRVGLRLREAGFSDVKLVTPNEAYPQRTLEVASALLSDPEARQFIGAISYHPYPYDSPFVSAEKILLQSAKGDPDKNEVEVRGKLKDLARESNLPLWMTEESNGSNDPFSFDDFRARSVQIHDELEYADASAFFGMWNMWDLVSQREHFNNDNLSSGPNEGTIVLIDNDKNTVNISAAGYAIAHFARWVKKGDVRVDSQTTDPAVQVTAFKTTSNNLVLVVVNNSSTDKTIKVNLRSAQFSGKLRAEQSTKNNYLQRSEPISLEERNSFIFKAPALSITTLSDKTSGNVPEPVSTGSLDVGSSLDDRISDDSSSFEPPFYGIILGPVSTSSANPAQSSPSAQTASSQNSLLGNLWEKISNFLKNLF